MATYVLTSMYEKEFNQNTVKMFKSVIKDTKRIVCIASDFNSPEMTDHFWNLFQEMFLKAGFDFEESYVVDSRMTPEKARDCVKGADVIWISGGDTPTEFKSIQEYGLDNVIKAFDGVVIGMSAGTLNLAKTVICAVCNGHDEQVIYNGLGLVDITAISHYDMGEIPQEIVELSAKHELYLMTDGSYILCKDKEKDFYGDILKIYNGEVETISSIC